MKNDERPDGVLRSSQHAYIGCLMIKKVELQDLLAQDETYWMDHCERIKQESNAMREQLDSLMIDLKKKL